MIENDPLDLLRRDEKFYPDEPDEQDEQEGDCLESLFGELSCELRKMRGQW